MSDEHKESGQDSVSIRPRRLKKRVYESELAKLQVRLARLQRFIRTNKRRVVVLFEGRDAAGKGGTIKRITAPLNPRVCRVVALDKPSPREQTQWYFQRYAAHLPAGGEMVLFDRSWYNRAGVERVMGFCTEDQYQNFLRACPVFERLLVQSGILLIKYWFSVSAEEQERRFQRRMADPTRRWKLSPMDLQSRAKWVEYSRAKDQMFLYTDIPEAPWYVVNSNDKRRARLNCISHLLTMIPHKELRAPAIELPPLQGDIGYLRSPMEKQTFVPNLFPYPEGVPPAYW